MPRFVRIGLILVVGLVILLAVAWVGLQAFLSSGKARSLAAAEISKRLGSEVRVEDIDLGATTAVTIALPGSDPAAPLVEGTVRLNASIYSLAGGSMPTVVTVEDAKVTLHLDRDGKILDPLPNPPPSEGGAKEPIPEIRVEKATVRVIQEGRPEFQLDAVDATVTQSGDRLVIQGKVADDAYGNWAIDGDWAADGSAGEVKAATDGKIPLTQERVKAIPFVPAATWETVGLDGQAALALRIGTRAKDGLFWHVEIDAADTHLQVFPAKLDMTDCAGKVVVDGAKVVVTDLVGTLADGTVKASADMDFGPTPAVLTFDVAASGVDVKKTPEFWQLRDRVEAGTLKGDGKITLKIPESGDIKPSGTGKAVISGKFAGGNLDVEVYLTGDGDRLKFVDVPPAMSLLPGDLHLPFVRAAVLMLQPPPAKAQPPEQAKPQADPPPKAEPETKYVRANLKLTDVDLAELLKKAKVTTPVKLAGKLSLQVSAEIPTNKPGTIAAYRATGKATAPTLQIEGLTLTGVTADVKLDNGVLTLDRLAADFQPDPRNTGGKAGSFLGTASFGIDPQTELKANLKLTEVPLKQVAAAVPGYADIADGILSGRVSVTMPGDKLDVIEAIVADGEVSSPGLSVYGQTAERLQAKFSLDKGVARLTQAEVAIYEGVVTGSAVVPLSGDKTGDVNVAIKDLNMAVLAKSIPQSPVNADGKVNGTVTATLPPVMNFDAKKLAGAFKLAAPTLVVRPKRSGQADAKAAESFTLNALTLDAKIDKGLVTLNRFSAEFPPDPKNPSGKGGGVSAAGRFGIDLQSEIQATVKLDNLPLLLVASLVPGYGDVASGLLSGDFRLTLPGTKAGDLEAATAEGMLSSPGLTVYGQKIGKLQARFALKDAVARLTDAEVDIFDGTVTGRAAVPIAGDKPGDFAVNFKDVDAAKLTAAIPDSPVSVQGQFSGSFKGTVPPVKGFDATKLTGDLDLSAPSLIVQGVPATALAGKVGYQPGAIAYDLNADALGGKVAVEGTYPLTDAAAPKADPAAPAEKKPEPQATGGGKVTITGVKLATLSRALKSPELEPLRGTLSATVEYAFGPEGPTGSGRVQLQQLNWGDTANEASEVEADVRVTPEGVVVPKFSGRFAGGTLRGSGDYDFLQPRRSRVTLTLENADAAVIAAPLGLTDVSGRLFVSLWSTVGPMIRGGGTVKAVRAKLAGIPVSELRVPYRLAYSPAGGVEFSTRDAAGTVAGGRVTARTEVRYDRTARVTGRVEFSDVNVAALAQGFGSSSFGVGRTTGQFDFTGTNVRSASDLNGTLVARFGETSVAELPILNAISTFISPVQALTRFDSGDLLARLGAGQLRIERLALASKSAKLFSDGTINLNGKLDLNVVYNTEQVGPNAPLLRQVARNIPAIGPVPVGLIVRVSEALSNRVVRLKVGGTTSRPLVSLDAAKTLSENAVKFFVNQYNPLSDFTP